MSAGPRPEIDRVLARFFAPLTALTLVLAIGSFAYGLHAAIQRPTPAWAVVGAVALPVMVMPLAWWAVRSQRRRLRAVATADGPLTDGQYRRALKASRRGPIPRDRSICLAAARIVWHHWTQWNGSAALQWVASGVCAVATVAAAAGAVSTGSPQLWWLAATMAAMGAQQSIAPAVLRWRMDRLTRAARG